MDSQATQVMVNGVKFFFGLLGSTVSFFRNTYYFFFNCLYPYIANYPTKVTHCILGLILALIIFKILMYFKSKIWVESTTTPELSKLTKTETKTSVNKTYIYWILLVLGISLVVLVVVSGAYVTFLS